MLREGRVTLDRSPEAVGKVVGISGRTIRRLEEAAPEAARPRPVTLDTLANFYGMRGRFLRQLGSWGELAPPDLTERLHDAARGFGVEPPDTSDPGAELLALATALARRPPPARPGQSDADAHAARRRGQLLAFLGAGASSAGDMPAEREAALELLATFAQLDRRRQRLLLELARELRGAREPKASA